LKTAENLLQPWRLLLYPQKACGSRSYAFIGGLADMEEALIAVAEQFVLTAGFIPISVPDILPMSISAACGLVQRSDHPIQYRLRHQRDWGISGTSEMGLSAFLTDEIFDEIDLPLRLTSTSRCYRPEICNSAVEAKLYRVHEFTKVEMFTVSTAEQSDELLQEIVQLQCDIFDHLQLHCRLLEMPTEELGAPAYRKFDLEAWMPGRGLWGEVSSASNCTDFQSRRLGIRYRTRDNGDVRFAHTCNGTALASSRAMIALIETHQHTKTGLSNLPPSISDRLKSERTSRIKIQSATIRRPEST